MYTIEEYRNTFISHLASKSTITEPTNLYTPIDYILNLGGKRLRPVLVLLTAELFGTDHRKAIDAAMAIEVFHNFSLVHDDIMDAAPKRRGKATVHEKWDVNTGILSGDAMLIMAYQYFEGYDAPTFKNLVALFSKTALEVCEGQQYDVDFETRTDVQIPEYLKMIEYKTAVLVAAAMQMGAIIAGASKQEQDAIYAFGLNLGIAFQLQDDYLDVFSDPKNFGKQIGGDIIANKKTYLYLTALEQSDDLTKQKLLDAYNMQPMNNDDKIAQITAIFSSSGAAATSKATINTYTKKAFAILDTMNFATDKKTVLQKFGEDLMSRSV